MDGSERRTSIAFSIAAACVALLHLYAAWYPSSGNWGFHHLAFFPDPAKIGVFLLMLLALVPGVQVFFLGRLGTLASRFSRLEMRWKVICLIAAGALCVGLFWLGRQKTFFLGDGFMILRWLPTIGTAADIPIHFAHEPLTGYLQWKLYLWMGARPGDEAPLAAVQWLSIASGTGAVAAYALLARVITREPAQRVLAFLILLSSGITQLFFGYVENYTPSVCGILFCIFFSIQYLRGSCHLLVPSVLFAVSCALNIGMLAFGIGLLYLYGVAVRRREYISLVISAAATAASLCVLLSISGHTVRSLSETFATTGSHFVGLVPVNNGWQAYTMFSISHLLEWVNVQMLLAPFVILVVILVASRRFSDLRWEDRAWRYLSIVSLAGAGFVAAFNSDIGMSRDWDIMATMSAGLLVGSTGAIVTLAGSRSFRERIAWIVLSVTLLHTVPWILLNADTEKSLNRFLVLPDDRVWGKKSFLVYEELGLYFHDLKEYGRSLKYYEEYVRLDSTNSRILTLVANAHDDLGHADSAIAVLRKAIRYDSSNAALFGNLGKLFVEERRFEEASTAFERQLDLSGGDPEALNSMGALILVWHQDYGRALPYFLRAIAARPGLSIAYLNAGICFQQQGDLRQAGVYYTKFIAMDPDHPKARQLRELMGKH